MNLTPVRIVIIKKSNNVCWQRYWGVETHIARGKMINYSLYGKEYGDSSKRKEKSKQKKKVELPYDMI